MSKTKVWVEDLDGKTHSRTYAPSGAPRLSREDFERWALGDFLLEHVMRSGWTVAAFGVEESA